MDPPALKLIAAEHLRLKWGGANLALPSPVPPALAPEASQGPNQQVHKHLWPLECSPNSLPWNLQSTLCPSLSISCPYFVLWSQGAPPDFDLYVPFMALCLS